jgi:hypothetical protein
MYVLLFKANLIHVFGSWTDRFENKWSMQFDGYQSITVSFTCFAFHCAAHYLLCGSSINLQLILDIPYHSDMLLWWGHHLLGIHMPKHLHNFICQFSKVIAKFNVGSFWCASSCVQSSMVEIISLLLKWVNDHTFRVLLSLFFLVGPIVRAIIMTTGQCCCVQRTLMSLYAQTGSIVPAIMLLYPVYSQNCWG